MSEPNNERQHMTDHTIRPIDQAISRRVKSVLDANHDRTNIQILLALGEAATGRPSDWLAEIDRQAPGLLGDRE